MPRWLGHTLNWLMWLAAAWVGGFIAALIVAGHGAAAIVILTTPVAVLGAAGTSLLLSVRPFGRIRRGIRIVFTTLMASAPIAALSVYGLASKPRYDLPSAFGFFWPFALAALIVAVVTDVAVLGDIYERKSPKAPNTIG